MKKITAKRGLSLLIVTFMCIAMVFITPISNMTSVSAASLIVQNSSFETADGNNKPTNWMVLTGADCMDGNLVSTDRAYTGSKSLKITDTSSALASGVRSASIYATAGDFYESTVYCYLSSGTAAYYIEFWNSNGTRLSAAASVLSTTDSWQQLKVSGSAPTGTVSITLLCYSLAANTGTSYFDSATLNGNGILLPNGDMETAYANAQPTEWEFDMTDNNDSAYVDNTYKHNGSYSVCLDDSSAIKGIAMRSSYFKATAGTSYTANAYLYNYSGAGWFLIEFWDSNKTRIGGDSYVSSGTGSWQKVSVTATAPVNTVAVTILLYSSMGNTGKSYFDDVSLEGLTSIKYVYGIDITSKKQYFADNYIIESMNDITRTVNPGTKYGSPVLEPEHTWEGYGTGNPTTLVNTVLYDSQDDIYKMYYGTYYTGTQTYYTCYATSSDGISWTKPLNLGICKFPDPDTGDSNNNIVRTHNLGAGTVYKDTAESDPNKTYKMLGWKGPWGSETDGQYIWYSADGVNFTQPYSTPRFSGLSGWHDVSYFVYNSINSQYMFSVKYWPITLDNPNLPRVQEMSTSMNFVDWTTPKLSFACDAQDRTTYTATDVYGLPIYPTDGGYFGFPEIFHHMNGSDDGTVDVQLAFSRDAYHWVRPSRAAVIPLGAPNTWEAGQIYPAAYPLEIGGEVRLYYGGLEHTHAVEGVGKTGFTSWRKDGFVSLNAGGTEGTVLTKPVTFTGNNALFLNVDASGGGSVKVEILDSSDNVKTGFAKSDCTAITTDNQNYKVTWNGTSDISSLTGQDIKFKIYMTNAKLYSLKTKTPIIKEAESYDSMSGITNNITYIGGCDNGDWVCFNNVNFGNGYSQLISKVAVDNGCAGQKMEVRLDSQTGNIIGTLTVQGTGGWTNFQEQSILLSNAYGTHNVYICFKGSNGVGNFDWFKFQ